MWPANQPAESRDRLRPLRTTEKNTDPRPEEVIIYTNVITNLLFAITGIIITTALLLQVLYYKNIPGNILLYLSNLFNVDEELNIPSFSPGRLIPRLPHWPV